MSPSLNLQSQIRALLAADSAVTALVPAANIFDKHAAGETFPKIQLGEHFESDADLTIERSMTKVLSTIHVWTRDGGLAGANTIANAIRAALAGKIIGFVDARFVDARFMRDDDGKTAHGVMHFEALFWSPA